MITIYNENSYTYLKSIPDNYFDWIITDPPYGIKIAEWDNKISKEFMDEIIRTSKNQIIFGWNYYTDMLPSTEGYIVWYKQPFLKTQAQCELIYTSLKQKPKVIHYRYAGNCEGYPGNLSVDYSKKSKHPTEKPIELLKNIVSTYVKKGEKVCDPFMGVGSTVLACMSLDIDCVGIELSEEYCNIANERIQRAMQDKKTR